MDRLEPRPALLAWAQARQRSPRGPVRARLNTFDPPTLANLAPRILRAIARAQTLPPIRDVIDALRLIPNDDVGWDEWSTMGMTVFAATDGCEQGREAFDSWSRKSKKHNRADVEERWDHWHRSPPTELSYGSLRHRAKAVDPSWEPPSRQPGCGLHRDKDSSGTEGQANNPEVGNRVEQQANHTHGGTQQLPFPLRWYGEEDPNIKREWLVKQMVPKTGAGLISGQWGTAKTFVAIDLAAAVMMGGCFAGRQVNRKGGVLFFAAEGASEIPIRIHGVIETKFPGQKRPLPFAWAESCPMLMEKNANERLASIAKQADDRMQSEFRVELVLIIIDTMSAAAGFKDENSSSEGQLVMNVLNELSKRTDALAIACDHFGKLVETGTRGTSAKEASADVIIACLGDKTQTGNLTNLRVAVRKLRGGATGHETAFTLRKVDMGVDEDREPITTCVVDWSPVTVPPAPEAAKGKGWPKSTTLFRGALITAIKLHGTEQKIPDGSTVRSVQLDKVREEFEKRYPLDGMNRKKELAKRRQVFKRSREEAEARGLIGCREIEGTFLVWPVNPEDGAAVPGPSVTPA